MARSLEAAGVAFCDTRLVGGDILGGGFQRGKNTGRGAGAGGLILCTAVVLRSFLDGAYPAAVVRASLYSEDVEARTIRSLGQGSAYERQFNWK